MSGVPFVLSDPDQIIATLPVLLGFHPEQSLVAVLIDTDNHTVEATVRLDIALGTRALTRHLIKLTHRSGCSSLLLAYYSPDDHSRDGLDLIGNLQAWDITILDAYLIGADRYWSMICDDPGCCPTEGNPLPASTTPVELTRVLSGCPAVAESRAAVESRYRPRPDLAPDPTAFQAAALLTRLSLRDRAHRALEALDRLSAVERPTGWPPEADIGRAALTVLLPDVHVRDYLLGRVAERDLTAVHAATDTLVAVALTTPRGQRGPVAATAAALLAITGDNPIAAREILALAPGERLADLIELALDGGFHPGDLRQLFLDALPLVLERLEDESHHSVDGVA